ALNSILYGSNSFQGLIQPYENARVRFVQYGFNAYATSSIGLWKSETGNSWFHTVLPQYGASYTIGFASGLAQGSASPLVNQYLSGYTSVWLPVNYTAAYKFVVIRK